MTEFDDGIVAYRIADLPGLGLVQVPQGISDAEVIAQVLGGDAEATQEKKTKKKP